MSITSNPSTLAHIRDLVLQASGRRDLVDSAGTSDEGMNRFINMGIRMLDGMIDSPKRITRYPEVLPIGSTRITMQNCRTVTEVWVSNDEDRYQLEKLSLNDFRTGYSDILLDIDTELTPPITNVGSGEGRPKFYTVGVIGATPEINLLDETAFGSDSDEKFKYDFYDMMLGDHYNQKAVLFAPIPDAEYQIMVFGSFFSKVLENDGDKNYWTVMFPNLVVQATMFQLDSFYRNTEGMKDWMNALQIGLRGLDRDVSDEESVDVLEMDG